MSFEPLCIEKLDIKIYSLLVSVLLSNENLYTGWYIIANHLFGPSLLGHRAGEGIMRLRHWLGMPPPAQLSSWTHALQIYFISCTCIRYSVYKICILLLQQRCTKMQQRLAPLNWQHHLSDVGNTVIIIGGESSCFVLRAIRPSNLTGWTVPWRNKIGIRATLIQLG